MTDDGEGQGAAATLEPDAGTRLCARFLALLPVTGVSLSAIGTPGQSTIGATDPVAARIEELQFELGVGPHWDALRSGKPVLVPDLVAQASTWSIFSAGAIELGAGALFAFPLAMGAVTVGVVDMYRTEPGMLDDRAVAAASALAASTAGAALRVAARAASEDAPIRSALVPEMRREVHQATGMIVAQLQVSATEAFARLQGRAFSSGQTVESVAHEVVMRRLKFRG